MKRKIFQLIKSSLKNQLCTHDKIKNKQKHSNYEIKIKQTKNSQK